MNTLEKLKKMEEALEKMTPEEIHFAIEEALKNIPVEYIEQYAPLERKLIREKDLNK